VNRAVGRLVGVRGAPWRAVVDAHGGISPLDGTAPLDWHVAGDDRWYSPGTEPSVRQRWYAGFPVAETRMRVGAGDIVQRIWCTADAGGITVVEFENETAASVAVAVTRRDILATRVLSENPPAGIDLPAGSVVLPLGHRSSVRIGIAHGAPRAGLLPADLPGHETVVRGWETACSVASRIVLDDHSIVAGVARTRCDILLGAGGEDSAVERVRLGEVHHDAILAVADEVQRRLRAEKRAKVLAWDTPHLLATGARACVLLGDERAAADIGSSWLRLADRPVEAPPAESPGGVAGIAWIESILCAPSPSGGSCAFLSRGIPRAWWGSAFEGHGLVADPWRTVSYAVRWHGTRPALLWETSGPAGLVVTAGDAAPGWHSTEAAGETLLPAPGPSGD
jgi:hypothetical protein